jgi:hypothetical protein
VTEEYRRPLSRLTSETDGSEQRPPSRVSDFRPSTEERERLGGVGPMLDDIDEVIDRAWRLLDEWELSNGEAASE